MKDKVTKASKVMELINKYPGWRNAKIASEADCDIGYVYAIRKKMVHREEPVQEVVTTTDAILDERAKNYGKFIEGARLMQGIKQFMRVNSEWSSMGADQREALEMIAHKLGRILNGNPDYVDNWRDIAGYATLVADRLEGRVR